MNGGECEYVTNEGTFYFCSVYKNRPKECANHNFPAQFCPIGVSKLELHNIDQIRMRINQGWRMIKNLSSESNTNIW
jgi:hypothetical protein